MLPFFGRKIKSKHMRNSSFESAQSNKSVDNVVQIHSDDQIKVRVDGKPRKKLIKGKYDVPKGRLKARASSASPPPISFARRVQGVSVTFESTLPTQVWQASPSPSPPPLCSSTQLDDRMVCSVSEAWTIRDADPLTRSLNQEQLQAQDKRIDSSCNNWPTDADMEDSSDDTSPSGVSQTSLSSCSSSDESVTDRRIQSRTTSSGSTNSSSTNTVTTDSGSSLDMRLIRSAADDTNIRPKQRHRHNMKKTDRSAAYSRKKGNENKRRNFPSSSSSSSDEDLEALGWDDKTIAALTNRNKIRQQSKLNPSNNVLNINHKPSFTVSQEPPKQGSKNNSLESQVNQCVLGTYMPISRTKQVQMQQPYPNVHVSHPHSCVLARRANNPGYGQKLNYSNASHRIKEPVRGSNIHGALRNTELLAIITNNYKPSHEWEERYKVLNVKKGDYVCVLSQPLSSRSTPSTEDARLSGNSSVNNKVGFSVIQHKNECNTWLYVRRWCVDHLVTTGPPGFVPRHYCRLLPSNELLHLWQQSQLAMHARSQNELTISAASPSPISIQLPPSDGARALNTALSRVQIIDFPMDANFHSPSTNSTTSVQIPGSFMRTRIENNPMHLLNHGLSFVGQNQLPPPPPGFGSGGSLGSETEDRDSGRGPSSGSEWGSGRGGSSNVTLDRTVVEKTSSDTGLERKILPNTDRPRNTKSAEESQLGWFAPDGSPWSGRNDEVCSHDSALQSPSVNDLTPQLQVKNLQNSVTEAETPILSKQFTAPVTLTTRTGYTPVLEMRSAGTPTLYAREIPNLILNGNDSLAASITTCATVIENRCGSDPEFVYREASNTPDPSCWEPYKTVIHVNENCLEKFTLV